MVGEQAIWREVGVFLKGKSYNLTRTEIREHISWHFLSFISSAGVLLSKPRRIPIRVTFTISILPKVGELGDFSKVTSLRCTTVHWIYTSNPKPTFVNHYTIWSFLALMLQIWNFNSLPTYFITESNLHGPSEISTSETPSCCLDSAPSAIPFCPPS